MSKEQTLQDLKAKVGQLPTLPTVVTRILQLVNNPKTTAEDIAKHIENDVALTSMVLKLANSAYYGIPQTISSIRTAIVVLGFNAIKNLIIPASMVRVFPQQQSQTAFSWEAFWLHSVEVGVYARALAKRFPALDSEQVFTAGLLHDIGRLVLKQVLPEKADEVTALVDQGTTWESAEVEVFEFLSVEAADALFQSWNFPDAIREPILFHHDPEQASRHVQAAWVIHMANFLSWHHGTRVVAGEQLICDWEAVRKSLNLKEEHCDDLIEAFQTELDKASAFVDMFGGHS